MCPLELDFTQSQMCPLETMNLNKMCPFTHNLYNLYWIYALLSRNQPCRDYALWEALFGKIWWEEAQKHFNGPGLGSSPEEDVRKVKITGEGYNADTFHFQHLARHKSTLTNPFSLQLILRLPLPLASPTPSISCFSADHK